jgi:WD40 repeat protein
MEDVPVPEEITCSDQVFDICFHTKANVVAVGLIDGSIDIWSYSVNDVNKLLFKNSFHSSSCRGVSFSDDGETLYSISSDKSIQGLNGNGQQVFYFPDAHDEPINKVINVSENVLATGDDSGVVKLWDVRTVKEICNWHLHEDFVSGFCFHQDSNTLLSVAGDATLCVYDVRNAKNVVRSDDQESELHCVQVIKGGKKVVCGSQDGVIQVFSWGRWGDCSDRFPGHPQTVDCMLKVDERTVITGSSDGLIRVVQIQPNKVLGVIGDHEGFPVEGICASSDKKLLGSFAHDEIVRFWDISMFAQDSGEAEEEEEEETDSVNNESVTRVARKSKAISHDKNSDDDSQDWEDVGDDDSEEEEEAEMAVEDGADSQSSSDEDDSDDSDDEEDQRSSKKLPTKTEKFYADL